MSDVPDPTPYERIGGEAGLRRMTQRMYALMDTLPEAAAVRAQHPSSLEGSEQKLFEFLSGWLGGPPLYEQAHGHPRLRQRHFPFAVTLQTRNQWIACFAQALHESAVAPDLAEPLLLRLFALGDWMRNQHEPEHAPPLPPMAAEPEARLPELAAVLEEYGVEGFFEAV